MNRPQRIVLSCLLALGLLMLAACDSTTTNPGIGTSPSYDDVQDPVPVATQTEPLTIAPCGLYIAATTEQAIARAHAAPKSPDMEQFPLAGGLSCSALLAAVPAVEANWGGHAVVYQLPALAHIDLARTPLVVHASMEWADPIAAAPPATATPTLAIADPSQDPGGVITSLLAAAKGGQWRLLAGLMLSIFVWAARQPWSLAKWIPWLATDRGGATLVLFLALLGGLGTSLAGSGPFGLSLLANSLSMAFTSAGGFVLVNRILNPKDATA